MNKKLAQFVSAYAKAGEDVKALLDSEAVGELAEKHYIPSKYKSDFISEVANYILGVSSKEEILALLIQAEINNEQSSMILAEIDGLLPLSSLPKTAIAPDLVVKQTIKTPETITVPATNIGWAQITEPAKETTSQSIPPLRTMAGDSKQIGYQSLAEETHSNSQDSLLNK